MKLIQKPVSILLTLIMVLGLFTIVPFSVGAATVSGTDGSITWTFDDETGTLTISGTGDMNGYGSDRRVQVSSSSWTYITTAPWGDFFGEVKLIVVEEGVTSIGENAFVGICRDAPASLKVQLPSTVTRICDNAFRYCNKLNEINLPNGLISIGNNAFDSCGELKTIDLPEGLVSIGDCAFEDAGCESLTIPESVETVGDFAFYLGDLKK